MPHRISPRSGVAFELGRGETLTVIDPTGEQVADLLAFRRDDVREVISSGRTLDYASRIYLTTGDSLYSNRSNILLEIIEDDVGRHDFLRVRRTRSASSMATAIRTRAASATLRPRSRPTGSSRT